MQRVLSKLIKNIRYNITTCLSTVNTYEILKFCVIVVLPVLLLHVLQEKIS